MQRVVNKNEFQVGKPHEELDQIARLMPFITHKGDRVSNCLFEQSKPWLMTATSYVDHNQVVGSGQVLARKQSLLDLWRILDK